ncbi:MAG: response regulator transcription factor [Hyphomicrobiaceae bacterium]
MLSRREMQCLGLLAAGFSNRGIAEALAISEPTVAMHLKNARKRLGARTREHAVAIAISCGFIKPAVPVTSDADDRVVPLPPLAAAS